jgi:hypothetical protein
LLFGEFAGGEGEYGLHGVCLRSNQVQAVATEKGVRDQKARALIAVYEWVIPDDAGCVATAKSKIDGSP